MGGLAKCECDSGFANNGSVQCGRCFDPVFMYPSECNRRRAYILEPSTEVTLDIPRNLTITQKGVTAHQGLVSWQGRYNLNPQSAHYFTVDSPSSYKLHLKSRALVSYQIIHDDKVVKSSPKSHSHSDYDQLPQGNYKLAIESHATVEVNFVVQDIF